MEEEKAKKSKRGGKRPGAGRKPLGEKPLVRTSFCLTEDQLKTIRAQGGSQWIRKLIDAKEKENLRIPEDAYLPAINPPPCPLPIYEFKVQAGFPSPAESYIAGMLDLNEYAGINPKKAFFVRATGESMNKIGIEEGDLLIVDTSREAANGDIVIMRIDNEFTVKRFIKEGDAIHLQPESTDPFFKPIYPKEGEEWVLTGVVVGSLRQL